MSTSGNLAAWSSLVGLLLPLLVAVVQQQHWSPRVRTIVGVAACAAAAAVTSYLQGTLDLHHFAESALVIFTLAKTSYLAVWKPTGTTGVIEQATSPRPRRRHTGARR